MTRLRALDGLRALAVAAVYVFHVKPRFAPGGYLGVDVFFVLSGFVITASLLRDHDRRGRIGLGAFYMRRWLRLMPALVVMLVLASIAVWTLNLVPRGYPGDLLAAVTYLYDFRHPWNDHQTPIGHTWSLGIEEQFYLVWPLVLMLLTRRWSRGRVAGVAAAGVVGFTVLRFALDGTVAPLTIRYTPLGHVDQLLMGALLSVVVGQVPAVVRRWAALAVVPLTVLLLRVPTAVNGEVIASLIALVTAAVILHLAAERSALTWALTRRPVLWLGDRSYGFYLYHLPALWVVTHLTSRSLLVQPGILALSLAVTALSWRLVEQPFLRLKDRRWSRQDVESSSPSSSRISAEHSCVSTLT